MSRAPRGHRKKTLRLSVQQVVVGLGFEVFGVDGSVIRGAGGQGFCRVGDQRLVQRAQLVAAQGDVQLAQGGAQIVGCAGNLDLVQGGGGLIACGGNMTVTQGGGALMAAGGGMHITEGTGWVMLAPSVEARSLNVGVLLAGSVKGNVTAVLNTPQALALGVAAGLVGGLVFGLLSRRRAKG